jgi:2-keto-4-pentenoate hydratase/2-oxohepta-3-ene-1,7-dioic acid hydratase in catechol pathway
MRLITYTSGQAGPPRIGVRVGHRVLDIESASRVEGQPLPATMKALLAQGRGALSRVQALAKAAQSRAGRFAGAMVEERAIRFMPPLADAHRFVRVANNFSTGGTQDSRLQVVAIDTARLSGHNAKAVPRADGSFDPYPEVVYVVGRAMKDVDADDAFDYALGVTLLGPGGTLGPEIVTLDEVGDPDDLWITCAVNGEESVRWNSRDQRWKPAEVLAHLSKAEALEPGDMVATGAPAARAALNTGDVVECSIQGVTTLRVVMGAAETA